MSREHTRYTARALKESSGPVQCRSGFTPRTAVQRGRGVNPLLQIIALAMYLLVPVATAKEGVVQCANLIYGENHTSVCFSDEFLSVAQRETSIVTERRFKSVKLGSDELFQYPFVMMTGQEEFHFTSKERENVKKYLEKGGFLLSSAGCSSKEWDRSIRREISTIFGTNTLRKIAMDEPLFRTVYEIKELKLTHGGEPPLLEGLEINGKLVMIYSPHGLNDTAHTEGCCCCGGNEIGNCIQVNINILVYALLH